jgi:hypothetical protein
MRFVFSRRIAHLYKTCTTRMLLDNAAKGYENMALERARGCQCEKALHGRRILPKRRTLVTLCITHSAL